MKPAVAALAPASFRQDPHPTRFVDRLPSHLLTALIFAIPITTAGSNILAGLLLVAWLVRCLGSGRLRADCQELRANHVALAALGFFGLHIVGMLWSADLPHALAQTQKEWKFLLLPVFLFCARRDHADRYVGALLAAMALCASLSICIRLGVLEPWGRATVGNPVPFGTHVVYGPLCAFAAYLAAERLLFRAEPGLTKLALGALLAVLVTGLFITAGRAGHVMFLSAAGLLGFQFVWALRKPRAGREAARPAALWKAMAVAAGVASAALFVAYAASGSFRAGLTEAVDDVRNYGVDPGSPVGERLAYGRAGLSVFLANPLLGVGTGDLAAEMDAVLTKDLVDVRRRSNPHSMYVQMMGQFGILGLVALGWLFAAQLRHALGRAPDGDNDSTRRIGVALPVLFALICLAESYLAVHTTALLFAAFSAFLYKREDAQPRGGEA